MAAAAIADAVVVAAVAAVAAVGEWSGSRGSAGTHGGRLANPFLPRARPCGICTNINSLIWAPGHSGTQVVKLVSKLLQIKGVHIDTTIKHIRDLLKFFKEFRISGFENCYSIANQTYMGLEIEIKCKDCSIQ